MRDARIEGPGSLASFIAPLDTQEPLVPGFWRSLVSVAKMTMPNVVAPRALFLGTPFERYDQSGLLSEVGPARELARASSKAARQEDCAVVVITNVSASHPRFASLVDAGFVALPSFPDTVLQVPSHFDALLARLPQGDRSSIRRNRRRFEKAGHRLERVRDGAAIASDLFACYRPFLERAKVKWQAHTEAYFAELPGLSEDVVLTCAKDRDDKISGFIVNFNDGSSVQSGRIGVHPRYDKKDAVYFRLLYHSVDHAIEQRAQTLSLEPTGYRMKRHLGLQRVPLSNLILGVSPLWKTVLKTAAGLGRVALSHLRDDDELEANY